MRDDELPAHLGERFGAFQSQVSLLVPVPLPEKIMERGRRRRQTSRALLASLAVVIAVGAGYSMMRPLRDDGHIGPAGVHGMASTPYAPPAWAFREAVGETIPFGFLPAEGRWVGTRQGIGTQCAGGSQPTSDGEVLAAQSVYDRQGGEITLLVYSAGLVASRAYDEYLAEVGRCRSVTEGGMAWHKRVEPLKFGAAAVRVTTEPVRAASTALDHVEVTLRYGSSLLFVSGHDAVSVDRVWAGLHDRLCAFARDCKPRGGRPPPLDVLSAGGAAWAVVLATDSSGDEGSLGRAVARAAELGYRTSIAAVDCDEGARTALGLATEPEYRYVAVYFASKTDADTFVASAEHPTTTGTTAVDTVGTVAVNTYCIG